MGRGAGAKRGTIKDFEKILEYIMLLSVPTRTLMIVLKNSQIPQCLPDLHSYYSKVEKFF